MRFKSIGRVVVFSACLGVFASAHALFAESVHIFLKPEKKTKLKSVTGGWPSHSVNTDTVSGDWLPKKHIGKPKFEDISCAVEVGDLGDDFVEWFNESIAGRKGFRGGGLILHEQAGVTRANFAGAFPTEIVFPGFDSAEKTCTDWQFALSITGVEGAPWLMKAKEKGNRTKCTSNLRMIFSGGGKSTVVDVLSSEEVHTIIHEADLDGDGEYEPLGMKIGNVTIRVPASQATFFEQWMQASGENPLFEAKSGDLLIRTSGQGDLGARFEGMQPISVTRMGDGSVRVEMLATSQRIAVK